MKNIQKKLINSDFLKMFKWVIAYLILMFLVKTFIFDIVLSINDSMVLKLLESLNDGTNFTLETSTDSTHYLKPLADFIAYMFISTILFLLFKLILNNMYLNVVINKELVIFETINNIMLFVSAIFVLAYSKVDTVNIGGPQITSSYAYVKGQNDMLNELITYLPQIVDYLEVLPYLSIVILFAIKGDRNKR